MKKKIPVKRKKVAGKGEKHSAHDVYKDEMVYETKHRELRELFNLFDTDKSGSIDEGEMTALLKMMRLADTDDDAEQILGELDADSSGYVDFDEFFDWMALQDEVNEAEGESIEEYVDEMFNMIDSGGDGFISAEEFRECLHNLGADLSPEDIQSMIHEVDEDGDGEIDKEEFTKMIEKHAKEV
jgi:calmodulin